MAESRIAEEKDRMKKQHSTAIDVVQQWRDKCESLDKVATGEQKKVKLLEGQLKETEEKASSMRRDLVEALQGSRSQEALANNLRAEIQEQQRQEATLQKQFEGKESTLRRILTHHERRPKLQEESNE